MKKVFLNSLFLLCALIVGTNTWATNIYELVTNVSQLSDGDVIIIASGTSGSCYAMGGANSSSNRKAVSVTVSDGEISTDVDNSNETTSTANTSSSARTLPFEVTLVQSNTRWHLKEVLSDGNVFLNGGYVNDKGKNQNHLKAAASAETSSGTVANGVYDITVNTTTYVATIKNQNNFSVKLNGTIIATYSSGQTDVYIYKKVTTIPTTTTITSTGITNSDLKNGTAAGSLTAAVTETSSGDAVVGAVVTWSSDDESVATINSSGVVTLVGTGTATLKASYAGDETYMKSSATYNITVTDTRVPTTTAIVTSGITNTDIKNGTTAGSASANVTITSSGAGVPSASVSWYSSDETVATINSAGAITLLKAGSTTIRAFYAGATISEVDYASSSDTYDLTVTDTRQVMSANATFNNTFFGISAITSWQTGDPTTATGTEKGVSVTYAKGTSSYYYCNASQIRCYSGNTLSFSAPSGFVITEIVFTSSSWNTATPSVGAMNKSNTKKWEGNASSLSFSWSSTTRIESAAITLAYPRSTASGNYGTICFSQSVTSATIGVDKFYTVAGFRGTADNITSVVIEEASAPLTAGKPYIFLSNAASQAFCVTGDMVAVPTTEDNNGLVGRFIAGTISDNDCTYILKNNKVCKVDGDAVNCPANRAYFNFDGMSAYVGAPGRGMIEISLDSNNATNIENVESSDKAVKFIENGQLFIKKDGFIYDVTGALVK